MKTKIAIFVAAVAICITVPAPYHQIGYVIEGCLIGWELRKLTQDVTNFYK